MRGLKKLRRLFAVRGTRTATSFIFKLLIGIFLAAILVPILLLIISPSTDAGLSLVSFYLSTLLPLAIATFIPIYLMFFKSYRKRLLSVNPLTVMVTIAALSWAYALILLPSFDFETLSVRIERKIGTELYLEVFLFAAFLLTLVFLTVRSVEKREKLPYVSLLQIYLVVIVMFRNLLSAVQLQPDYVLSFLALFPVLITPLWISISNRLTLKSLKARKVSGEFLETVNELKEVAGIEKEVDVYSAPAVEGFATVLGIRKPALIVSELLVRSKKLRPIILHEFIHFRNLDMLAHTLSVTAFGSMAFSGMLFLILFFTGNVEGDVLETCAETFFLNPLVVLFMEAWCYRFREVHADLSVQEAGFDIAGVLKGISLPGKEEDISSDSEGRARLKYLKEPYRAFIPSYPEGFMFAVFANYLWMLADFARHQVADAVLRLSMCLIAGMLVAIYLLFDLQLNELHAQRSKAGVELGISLSPTRFMPSLADLVSNLEEAIGGFIIGLFIILLIRGYLGEFSL